MNVETWHGKHWGYSWNGCRCDLCREAHRIESRRTLGNAHKKPTPPDAHGTMRGYGYYGCRCDECKAVWTDYWRKRRATKATPKEGTTHE